MIVAVHIYAGLGKIVAQNALEALFQFGALLLGQGDAQMFGDIPLREQIQLAAQQRFIVGRKLVFFRGELNLDQSIRGGAIEPGCVIRR